MSSPSPSVSTTESVPTVPRDLEDTAFTLGDLAQKLASEGIPEYPRVNRFIEPITEPEKQYIAHGKRQLGERRPGEELAKNYFADVAQGEYFSPVENINRGYSSDVLSGKYISPVEGINRGYSSDVLSGKYLDPNKGPLKQQIESVTADTLEAARRQTGDILGRTGAAGGSGGSREALMLGQAAGETNRGLASAIANLTGEQYGRERGIQQLASQAQTEQYGRERGIQQLASEAQTEQHGKERILQQTGAEQLPGLEALPFQRTMQGLELEGIGRNMAQAEQNAQNLQAKEEYQAAYSPIQLAQAIFGQRLGQTIPIVAPGSNPLTGIAGLLGGAGGLLSGLSNLTKTTTSTPAGSGTSGIGGLAGIFKNLFTGE